MKVDDLFPAITVDRLTFMLHPIFPGECSAAREDGVIG
jgi:hypothetical protein